MADPSLGNIKNLFSALAEVLVTDTIKGYGATGQDVVEHGPIGAITHDPWQNVPNMLDFVPGVGKVLGGAAKLGVKGATLFPFFRVVPKGELSAGARRAAESINKAADRVAGEEGMIPESAWKEIAENSEDLKALDEDYAGGLLDIEFVGSSRPTITQAELRADAGANPTISGPPVRRTIGVRRGYGDDGRVYVGAPPETGAFSTTERDAVHGLLDHLKEYPIHRDVAGDRFAAEEVQRLFPDAQVAHIQGPHRELWDPNIRYPLANTEGANSPYVHTMDMGGSRYRPRTASEPRHGPGRINREGYSTQEATGYTPMVSDVAGPDFAKDVEGIDLGTTQYVNWLDSPPRTPLHTLIEESAAGYPSDVVAKYLTHLRTGYQYENMGGPARGYTSAESIDALRDILHERGLYPAPGPIPETVTSDRGRLEKLIRHFGSVQDPRPK